MGKGKVNTYADPLLDPLSVSSFLAPMTTVSPSIDTLVPNQSLAAPSSAVSFASCVQPEPRSPGVSRLNTYADPLSDPLSSSTYAPITIVLPSIDTLSPKRSLAAPSSAVSLASCVQPEAGSPAVSRVNTYADPLLDPMSSS